MRVKPYLLPFRRREREREAREACDEVFIRSAHAVLR